MAHAEQIGSDINTGLKRLDLGRQGAVSKAVHPAFPKIMTPHEKTLSHEKVYKH